MKSLAESVLSSTSSDKNRKIDVFYLLKHGFELDTSYGNQKKFIYKETGCRLIKHGDKIVQVYNNIVFMFWNIKTGALEGKTEYNFERMLISIKKTN